MSYMKYKSIHLKTQWIDDFKSHAEAFLSFFLRATERDYRLVIIPGCLPENSERRKVACYRKRMFARPFLLRPGKPGSFGGNDRGKSKSKIWLLQSSRFESWESRRHFASLAFVRNYRSHNHFLLPGFTSYDDECECGNSLLEKSRFMNRENGRGELFSSNPL